MMMFFMMPYIIFDSNMIRKICIDRVERYVYDIVSTIPHIRIHTARIKYQCSFLNRANIEL